MINPYDNHWIPSEGYKYITNGTVWSDGIYLGRADDISNWHDTNEEPSEPDTDIDDSEALNILLGLEGGDVE